MTQRSWLTRDDREPPTVRGVAVIPPPLPPSLAGPTDSEPVIIAHAVTVILGALVTAGWVTIPDSTVNVIVTVIALVGSTLGVIVARGKVSPTKAGLDPGAVATYVADLVAYEVAQLGPRR